MLERFLGILTSSVICFINDLINNLIWRNWVWLVSSFLVVIQIRDLEIQPNISHGLKLKTPSLTKISMAESIPGSPP